MLRVVDSPARGVRRWLWGSSQEIGKKEGRSQVGPTLCHPGPIMGSFHEEPKEEKDEAVLSRAQRPRLARPCCRPRGGPCARALRGKHFPHPNPLVAHAT